MAYRKVLIPLDGSKEAEGVIRAVESELEDDAEVLFLQVIKPAYAGTPGIGPVDLDQAAERENAEAMSYCEALLDRLDGKVRGRCEVTEGAPVFQAIVNEAVSNNADLVAMYTHDREGLARVRSISANVQRRVPPDAMPVRVLRPEEIPRSRGPTGRAEPWGAVRSLLKIPLVVALAVGSTAMAVILLAVLALVGPVVQAVGRSETARDSKSRGLRTKGRRHRVQIFDAITRKGGEPMKAVKPHTSEQAARGVTSELELDVLRRVDLFRELTDE